MSKSIADLHCHPSLKPALNKEQLPNMWMSKKNITTAKLFYKFKEVVRKWAVNLFLKPMAKFTQSNLESCYKGNNKLVFFALYPPERPFMKPNRPFNDPKNSSLQTEILQGLFKETFEEGKDIDVKVIRALTGFSKQAIHHFLDDIYENEFVDYYQDFINEYDLIKNTTKESRTIPGYPTPVKLKLVNSFDEMTKTANHEIAGVITLEGAHALGCFKREFLFKDLHFDSPDLPDSEKNRLRKTIEHNVDKMKDLEYPPFFITFSHHFNNFLSGHAKSFKDAKNAVLPGFSSVFNQEAAMNMGFTEFGADLITKKLLSKDNGRRVLIDTKHMSVQCRDEYLNLIKTIDEPIPIICSHTAVNGITTRKKAAKIMLDKKRDEDSFISRWDINLTDEDIIDIFVSDGIIGICMHDGRMPGEEFLDLLKQESRKLGSRERVKRLHQQMFLTNVFHVVKVNLSYIQEWNANPLNQDKINEKEAWKTIALGTDFDGIIDPFDHWNSSSTLNGFKARCSDAIKYNFGGRADKERKRFRILDITEGPTKELPEMEFEHLKCGFDHKELIEKIFYQNVHDFCKKYFNDTYLA